MRRGRGEGSIYQRHDAKTCPPVETDAEGNQYRPEHRCQGRWVANLDYGWSAGKRQRKVIYGRTKAEVQEKLAKERERNPGHRKRGGHTVETWMNYWLDNIASSRVKPQTMRSYRSKTEQYIVPLLGRHRLDRLEPRHVRDMHKAMRKRGLAEATLRQTHAILSRALKVAVREEETYRNVADLVDSPSTETNKRRALTLAEANVVLRAAAGDEQEARWYAALVLGMRQGEALGLTWEWVNLDEAVLYVERTIEVGEDGKLAVGTPKSRTSRRPIPLPPNVVSRLKVEWGRHVERERKKGRAPRLDAYVWAQDDGKPWHPKSDWNHWRDLLKAAGVPHTALHAARDTAAQLLEQMGVPDRLASEILGHSDVRVTHGYQMGAGLDVRREALDRLGDLGAGAPPDTPAIED